MKHRLTIPTLILSSLLLLCGIGERLCFAAANPEPGQTLTLEEAVQLVLINNRSLTRSRLGIDSSRLSYQSRQQEFQLKILPSAQTGYSSASEEVWRAGAGFSKNFASGLTLTLNPFVGGENSELRTGIAARLDLPLLRGAGKDFALDAVYSSLYSYRNAKLSYHIQQVDTVLQTVQTVYGILLSNQQIALLENQLQVLQRHLALAKIKEKAGIISVIDLYRAEIRIKNVERELSIRQESRLRGLDQLKRLLALPQDRDLVITAPIDYQPVVLDEAEAVDIALANRPELEQTERLIEENKRQLKLAERRLLPQLNLQLGYDQTGEDLDFGFEEEIWTIRLSSDTDLFRRSEKNTYAQKQISYRQTLLDQISEKERIIQEVRAQLTTLEQQLQRISLRDEQLYQTRGKLRLAESKFRHGMADNFDLIEAQTEMQEAQSDLLSEQINYLLQTYRLRSTLGTLLEYRENHIEETP